MKFSKAFGNSYDFFMFFLEKFFLKTRRARLISALKGNLLEIGVGTGVNFKFYSKEVKLKGIEPSPHMFVRAEKRKSLLHFPDRFTLHNIGCGYPEMENLVENETYDAIICTLVLCTIPEPEIAIENFYKWLKPGGKLVLIEHIKSHNQKFANFQNKLNPMWEKFAEGCQLNRSTDVLLENSGFNLLTKKSFNIIIPFFEAEYIKPKNQQ